MEWLRAISREEMANLPIRRYEGEVRLVATAEALERERDAILRERLLGFDTETRPAFRRGERYAPSLVQLAGESVVWVFQIQRSDFSSFLARVFTSASIVKAGVAIGDDLRLLKA